VKIQLLIVDDEPLITEQLSRHFRYLGYEVDTASDGVEAMEKLKHHNFQIVISDVLMPRMDGVELLKAIKAYDGGTHVIMITGRVTMENILASRRRGADTVLFKPLDNLDELVAAVEAAVTDLEHWQRILKRLQAVPVEK
jgi:CheY-like chemotaxis protein